MLYLRETVLTAFFRLQFFFYLRINANVLFHTIRIHGDVVSKIATANFYSAIKNGIVHVKVPQ
jgi:hypothetical protein